MTKKETAQLIGVFGGTFNPIHNAHLLIAEEARVRLKLNKIIFIPSSNPPHKKVSKLIGGHHRLNMVKLAIKDNPFFTSSDIEIRRGGKSYSIETIRQLKKNYEGAELFFIIGADSILDFTAWKDWDALLELCNFAVFSRPGYEFVGSDFTLIKNKMRGVLRDKSLINKIIYFKTNVFDVSSTDIRGKIRKNESVKYLVPDEVIKYIKKHKLYEK